MDCLTWELTPVHHCLVRLFLSIIIVSAAVHLIVPGMHIELSQFSTAGDFVGKLYCVAALTVCCASSRLLTNGPASYDCLNMTWPDEPSDRDGQLQVEESLKRLLARGQ